MDPDEIKVFRGRLDDLINDLETAVSSDDAAIASIEPDKAIGRLTRMEAIQAQAMGQEGKRRLEGRLQRAKRALERVDNGTYGLCAKCGAKIPQGRLEVMPESALCVTCAARAG